MIIRNALTFQEDGSFPKRDIKIKQGRFSREGDGEVLDAEGLYAIPGLIDLHFHGCVGYDFCDGTPEALRAITRYQRAAGITAICPATMTYPEEKLAAICANAAAWNEDGAALVGIHLEGPFLSAAKKGAQNGAWLRDPDVSFFWRLQEKAAGKIRLLDIAPELPGATDLIRRVSGCVSVSLAHTEANYETAVRAFQSGACHVTHLYNAMPPFLHRSPGVVGAAIDTPQCRVELICDGVHVHPSVVRATFQMFGDDRVILISDSMMATGLPDGSYMLGGQPVSVHGNRCTLADGTIAGSASNLMECLRTAVLKMNVPLGSAVKAATVNPAKALGIFSTYGSLAIGKRADLLLLDPSLRLVQVVQGGRFVKEKITE